LNGPLGVATLPDGTVVFTEQGNHRLCRYDPATGNVTTLAGTGAAGFHDGPGGTAQCNHPRSLAVDGNGNVLVAEWSNHRIRCFDTTTNNVSTLAGTGTTGFQDGPAGTAQFNNPSGLAIDGDGNVLVADVGNHRIRCLDRTSNNVATLTGTGTAGF